jgi:acetoin utilization protein AcuC
MVWDDALVDYDPGPGHPLRPIRLELTLALARQSGLLTQPNVTVLAPVAADEQILGLVHDLDYMGCVQALSDPNQLDIAHERQAFRYGLGTGDNPIFARMHEAAALVTGASVTAARQVWSGGSEHAVSLAGGLHHAMRDRASGFCVYDDPAVAIAWLLAQGAERVAYVDVDVHHGDGVQAAFYADPRVLTISLHESGRTLFPGTGWPDEIGTGFGAGTSVNVALPAGTGDAGWLRAFDAVVPPLLHAFQPEVLVSQHGCDTHAWDPLANLTCSIDGQLAAYRRLHDLAHTTAGGRWVALGGGGYELVRVVPRAWTGLLAEMAGVTLPKQLPDDWRAGAQEVLAGGVQGRGATRQDAVPAAFTDGVAFEVQPWVSAGADPLDVAVQATRDAVFAAHGLAA